MNLYLEHETANSAAKRFTFARRVNDIYSEPIRLGSSFPGVSVAESLDELKKASSFHLQLIEPLRKCLETHLSYADNYFFLYEEVGRYASYLARTLSVTKANADESTNPTAHLAALIERINQQHGVECEPPTTQSKLPLQPDNQDETSATIWMRAGRLARNGERA